MASIIMTCIHSALGDMELLVNAPVFPRYEVDVFKILRLRLRNLRTFVLAAKKLSNDESLRSFLLRIGDTVCRTAEEIHPHCLTLNRLVLRMASDFQTVIESLHEEIDEWYVSILNYAQESSFLATDEVLEIISSILENLADFQCLRSRILHFETFGESMESLGEQMAFLKSLTRFAAQRSVEQAEDLLAHTEAAAINAAHLFQACTVLNFDEERCSEMQFNISQLLLKIKPIDPQACKIYTQALICLKLPRQSLAPRQDIDDDALIKTRDFLDSLLCNLWEMLRVNTFVVSLKDQLQDLFEALRLLRAIIKQQPNNIDGNIKEDIGTMVCDAGILICSFYQADTEADIGLKELLETIKIILAEIGEKDPQVPMLSFPRINELGFVDYLLEKLELASCKADARANSCVQTIQEVLVFLRSFLGKIVELRNEQEELQTLWDRVLHVAYRVECVIEHLVVGDLPDSFLTSFDSVMEDIKNVKEDVLEIFHDQGLEIKAKEETSTYSHVPSQRTPTIANEVVGFENDAEIIIDRLTRGSKQLRIVAIVGMPGLGKTTLATKVYHDPSILLYFYVRAWCPISQVIGRRKVLLDLLNQIDPNKCSEMTEQDLVEKLWRSLKGRKYLIFLDDIWDIEAWNSLEGSFPDDNVGSRIILTSRVHDIAPDYMLDQAPHVVHELNIEESQELLQRKLFPGNSWPPALLDLRMQIAEKCKGLPLAIVVVAGLLTTIEPEGWDKILDGLSLGTVSSTEHCMNTMGLSYKHLPTYLRPCLLYFGAFRDDEEVSVRRLLRLWIAEGFVRKDEKRSQEDAAEDYLKDLISRSLIMVSKQRSDGGVKACRIHDLLHDFCLQRAKDEHFFSLLKGYDELSAFNEPRHLHRLCVYSEAEDFKQSKLFCPRARSLLFNSSQEIQVLLDLSFVVHIFKFLRVLDLEQIFLGSGFPSEIELLVLLAFLAIRGAMRHIPSSISNLSNLETFIVNAGYNMLSLPESLWNLQKLKYLYIISDLPFGGGSLPEKNLDSSSILYELDRFSGAVIPHSGNMEMLMRKFPKIRKLKCRLFQYGDDIKNLDNIVFPDFLSELESLHIALSTGLPLSCMFEFSLPENLKKLTLSNCHLAGWNISAIGKLPKLEVLKLLHIFFKEETWEMEEGEFSRLKFLKLDSVKLVSWRACDDQFDCLQKLELKMCGHLEEIPSCLECIETLQLIEVSYCPETVVNLVRQIEEEQASYGNSDLKIIVRSFS